MIKVLVTGSNGQLGQCLRDQISKFPNVSGIFATREELDITRKKEVISYFENNNFDYCINTAAYTNVEKAESEEQNAFLINAEGAFNISEACKENDVVLLHVSTDYVFDGKKNSPYLETDATNPINVYGASKLKGEQNIKNSWHKHFIIRTSWLYSQYGHNFLTSMLRLAKAKKTLTITTEQTGTPTNANDLAIVLFRIIEQQHTDYGIYHCSNKGTATWYDFAKAIFEYKEIDTISLAKTDHYPTFAQRPMYSVMDCGKLKTKLNIEIIDWESSLQKLLNRK